LNSSMIGKIEKAHRYAREPERIRINHLSATFHGSHDDYRLHLENDTWTCTCHTFESHVVGSTCAHVMAMQQILTKMLDDDARYSPPESTAEAVASAS